jgi:hypothetical protein
LLDEEDCQQFWGAYAVLDGPAFAAVMQRALDRLEQFHRDGFYHARTVQLLRDALRWGIKNPTVLLEGGRHELDSPNLVAFSLLIGMFHRLNERTGARVVTFIHDEQNQFGKYLIKSYDLLKGFAFEQANIAAPLPDYRKAMTFGCALQVASSKACIGLQLADVALWLTKRFVERGEAIHGKARTLAEYIVKNGMISALTRKQMIEDTQKVMAELESKPLTKDTEQRAREFLAELEEKRVARMNAPLEVTESAADYNPNLDTKH